VPEKDVGGRDDGSAGDGGGRRCRLLLGDDRPGPRSRLSNPDSKVSLAAMACAGVVVCVSSSRSRFGHNVRRPTQFVCPNSDSVCPNSDKIYLTVVTFRFLLLFFAY